MSKPIHIHREVSEDGRTLTIEFLDGIHLSITRDEAIALLDVIQEKLPEMACVI